MEMVPLFWIINFTIFIAELILGGLFSNLNDLIVQRFKFDYVFTGNLLLIPYVLGSIVSVIFGKMLMTKPTWRRTIILISSIMMLIGNILLYILPNSNDSEITALHYVVVIIFLVMMSVLSGSIYTVICSSVSVLADSKRLGTAWGVIGTAIALG
jgi:nitrate/nitrite transporter NarK